MKYRKSPVAWSMEEMRMLRQLSATQTLAEVAAELGRTRSSVKARAARLGIPFRKYGEGCSHTVYSNDTIDKAFKMRKQGATLKEISMETGMHASYARRVLNYEYRFRDSFRLGE